MFGTVILDAYTKKEINPLAFAIDDLCSPSDNYGWSSAGIYCFWNYYTNEVLYIGLASDLYERFRQHNGLIPINHEGCKFKNIQEYFEKYEKLGYSIFVQSPISQPLVYRNKAHYEKFASDNKSLVSDMVSSQGVEDIKCVEGILIEAFNQTYGRFPSWNKVGGSVHGQKRVLTNNINIVHCLANPQDCIRNCIVSRSSIRELSNNPTFERYESFLHGIRQLMLMFGMDYKGAVNIMGKFVSLDIMDEMKENGYLAKRLIL